MTAVLVAPAPAPAPAAAAVVALLNFATAGLAVVGCVAAAVFAALEPSHSGFAVVAERPAAELDSERAANVEAEQHQG